MLSAVLSRSVVSYSLRPVDCSPPGSSVHGDSSGKNSGGVGCHALLQGIFPTQGLNPGLLHRRQILDSLSHQGSPRVLEWVAYPFSRGSFPPGNWTRISYIADGFFTSWATKEALHLGISSVFAALMVKGHLNALYTMTTPDIINPNFFLWLDILRQDTDYGFQQKQFLLVYLERCFLRVP